MRELIFIPLYIDFFSGNSVYLKLINLLLLMNRLFIIPNVRKDFKTDS